jgi:hypothetical protein
MLLTSGQSILEDLLEAQELQNGQIDRRVESKTAFVGAKSRVELDTISAVDLGLELVIFPDDTELDDPLRDRNDLESFLVFRVFFEKRGMFEGGGQLWNTQS